MNGYVFLIYSYVSSVGIVILNKLLYSTLKFQAGTFLMSMNALVTFVCCCVLTVSSELLFGGGSYYGNLFKTKHIPINLVLKGAITTAGSILFGNLSLMYNSVGVFQISKMMIIPAQIGLLYFLHGKKTSLMTILSLLLLCAGVGIVVVTDVEMNLLGLVYSLLTVATTSISQVYVSEITKEVNCNPFQLLLWTSPFISLFILASSPVLDNWEGLDPLPLVSLILIFGSCLMAFHVNFSAYLLLDNSGPITYQVLGQIKTISVVFFGALLFSKTALPIGYYVGIVIAIGSSIWYSYLKIVESSQPTNTVDNNSKDDKKDINIIHSPKNVDSSAQEDLADTASDTISLLLDSHSRKSDRGNEIQRQQQQIV